MGTRVTYRLELIPWMVWTLVLSYLVGIPLLAILVLRNLYPVSALVWVFVLTAVFLPMNFWFSERQARRLRDYVAAVLSAN